MVAVCVAVVTSVVAARKGGEAAGLRRAIASQRIADASLAEESPDQGYERAEPGLEDVYFAAMRRAHAPDAPFAADAESAAPAFGAPGAA